MTKIKRRVNSDVARRLDAYAAEWPNQSQAGRFIWQLVGVLDT